MDKENNKQKSKRILNKLKEKYPGKDVFDLDGRALHFVCEIEPTKDHSEYDRAIEVIISSKPHKHLKTTQYYKILSGELKLCVEDFVTVLKPGDTYTVPPNTVHWAESNDECWLEIRSEPGWTKEDHIPVDLKNDR